MSQSSLNQQIRDAALELLGKVQELIDLSIQLREDEFDEEALLEEHGEK